LDGAAWRVTAREHVRRMSDVRCGLKPIEQCRSCGSRDLSVFLSLGDLPLSDGLLRAKQLAGDEPR
jgi:hypothetical protein